ncbi:hypothetical protein [Symbiobacterium terraclitae]|uniref:hypothetical protein n=1 Tax=Symbiobacterium terraclitae TaxID=557451 RepID=UPI0035B53A2B
MMTPSALDAHVRAIVRWHFDPATGCPYWLRKAAELGFDPLAEVQGLEDLARFPAVAAEWRRIPAWELIPRGCREPFDVWETGGTTGPPTRIVDATERTRGIRRVDRMLDDHGFPRGDGRKGWLHLGPTGPHLVGTNVARLARLRDFLYFTVDLDPRWVKRLYREGRPDEARRYTAHLVDQALAVLEGQPVEVLSTTPPLLQALCERPETYALLAAQVKGIIWFGTSLSSEGLRLLEEELLPDARLVGWYGNTLMGIACQRPRREGDAHRCVFAPPGPDAVVRVVDPRDPARRVAPGEAGQVRISLLTRELFLPWHLERDRAVRVDWEGGALWDHVAEVAPLDGGGARVEGVY